MLLVHLLFLSIEKDGGGSLEDSLGGSLHDEKILLLLGDVVDGHLRERRGSLGGGKGSHLVLVGRVEGDLSDLRVLLSVASDVSESELRELEQSDLGSVSSALSAEDGNVCLANLELGSVAEGGHASESSGGRALRERRLMGKREGKLTVFLRTTAPED